MGEDIWLLDYFYNARASDTGSYYIARGQATKDFGRASPGPVMIRPDHGWMSRDVAHPKPFMVGGELRVYFSGYDGAWQGMGLAVGGLDSLEVVGRVFGPAEGWEAEGQDAGLRKLTPFYDGDWWVAYNGGGLPGASIGLAASVNGLKWERQGVILRPEGHHIATGPVIRDDKLYMFYSEHDGEFYTPHIAWFDEEWVKGGPILQRRSNATSDCEVYEQSVGVPSTESFQVGESAWIFDRRNSELVRITGKTDKALELEKPVRNKYSMATIRSWAYGSMTAEDIYFDGHLWRLLLTCFHVVPHYTREVMGVATAKSLLGPWTLQEGAPNDTNSRDRLSFENPNIVKVL